MQDVFSPEQATVNYDVRRYHDTVTWLAEVLPGWMRTPFEYRFDGRELYGADGGALSPIFDDAIEAAQHLPTFEQRRRLIEREEYEDMLAMMKGDLPNTMVVVSDFPLELMTATQDEGGYNTERKQTMLRVIYKTPDNTLKMVSQSLDGSDRQALESIYKNFDQKPEQGELLGQRIQTQLEDHEQEFLIDWLTGVYDRSLALQYGGDWFAGRPTPKGENTYDFVGRQTDLINAYITTIERPDADFNKYALAAAVKNRFVNGYVQLPRIAQPAIVAHDLALQEMFLEGARAQRRGEVFSGCGASLRAGNFDPLSAMEELSESGYGNKSSEAGEDKYGPLNFKCPKGHWNKRKPAKSPKDFLPHCKTCGTSLKC